MSTLRPGLHCHYANRSPFDGLRVTAEHVTNGNRLIGHLVGFTPNGSTVIRPDGIGVDVPLRNGQWNMEITASVLASAT
jgi:hypothetical protein